MLFTFAVDGKKSKILHLGGDVLHHLASHTTSISSEKTADDISAASNGAKVASCSGSSKTKARHHAADTCCHLYAARSIRNFA